ncbi:unnamed protein product [Porites lobata]|uniref:Uncharacterized protein n=1 Tax=Porites lobata TaxID=104759 RepID=A0ABN8P939_9CNID|nr:unnamed protein product [Porites lobata]
MKAGLPLKAKAPNRQSRQLLLFMIRMTPGQKTSPTMLSILSAFQANEAHPKLQDDDALSLCGDYGLVNEPLEPEDELNNDGLLTQITTFLSSSNESGLSVSDKLSKLVNAKFQTQYSGDERKEILQMYKTPKSVFIPLEKMIFWGFIIDSVRMIVMLTEDKIHKLKDLLIFPMDNAHSLRIRDIARLIGHLV